ncbi:serine--tRNA ligase [Cohnella panacarvi]|uniref:serine--tRNA ligase n=1 Tax=Cohnella panacarvi TaxID=400776 RepID=UPI00047EBCC8|nr:serine--tRNA ligase [Cohnella panacarvi]
MLDIRYIRDHAEQIQQTADAKGIGLSIVKLLEVDEHRRALMQEIEQLRHGRNRASEKIGGLMESGNKAEAERLKAEVKWNNETLKRLEGQQAQVETAYIELMRLVPNPVSEDTPPGQSDADNVEIKRVGEKPDFAFAPRDHVAIGEALGLFDIPRGVKMAGARNYVLKGAGFRLHRAVQHLAMDVLEEAGFTPMDVPMLVREDALVGSGYFPLGRDQTYALADDNKYLVGTSEVSLAAYYGDEVIDVGKPVKLAAMSACFRREVGSQGRDVRGLYRVHQFSKVEQVVLCANDPGLSERLLQEITGNAERILQLLELPYRVVSVCIGDMSQKNYKQYDIETWMPSRESYGETHSSSNVHEFQARRANIRYRDADGKLHYCHMLNNTAIATPRILIPLLENHQREDGGVYIPKALRPYMQGQTELKPEG